MMVLGDACAGFGSCLLRSAMPAADLGQVVLSSSQLQIDDSGDVFIEYYTNSTSQTTDCTGHGTSTTVRFRCPGRQLVSLTCLEIVVVSIVQLRELHTTICITLSGSLFSLLSVSFFVIRTTVSILYSLSFTTGWKSAQVVNSHLVWDPHNPTTGFWPRSATVVSAELFLHGTGTLQKEMATYRHWSVSLWGDPDDVPHCRILSPDKTERRLILTTLCRRRRCFMANQSWFMTCIREEEDYRLKTCLFHKSFLP